MKKRLLTIEDLIKFCENQNFSKFSSKDVGYSLSVQTPAMFEVVENEDESRRGLLKLKIKVYHKGRNRNGSSVPDDAAENAKNSIKNRPVLAAIHQLDNGEWDFETHNIRVTTDDDGNEVVEYIERQVGSFSEDEPFFEYDEENDKEFCCSYAYIPEEYTKTAEILRTKNGTKTSCELSVDEFSYDAKEKCLILKKFYVEGVTLLGRRKDGTPIGEGMLGARADIEDFSRKNNSVVFNMSNIEMLNEINAKLDKLVDFTNNNLEKGGNANMKFEELLSKYNVTVEDIEFDYENMSEEELISAFEEAFGEIIDDEEETVIENDNDGTVVENDNDNDDNADDDSDGNGEEDSNDVLTNSLEYSVSIGGVTKNFELSYNEIESALYNLVNDTYSDADGVWYGVIVYEDYLIMTSWCGSDYKQTYKREGDEFTLTGDRTEVFAKFLTQEEIDELDALRKNYDDASEKVAKYEKAEADAQKNNILHEEVYSKYLETEEFKELEKNKDSYSVEEFAEKVDLAFSKCVKRLGFSIEGKDKPNKANKFPLTSRNSNNQIKQSRYGSLKFN